MRRLLVVIGAIGYGALGSAASVDAATPARPTIVSFAISTTHDPLPASGAAVVVTVAVRQASTCTFLIRRGAATAFHAVKSVACASGHARVTLHASANKTHARVRITVAVQARGAGAGAAQRSVTLRQAAATAHPSPTKKSPPSPQPPTVTLAINQTTLPSTGGLIVLVYSATNATSCELASTPAFSSDADPATVACAGTYQSPVPANPSGGRWTFTFTATDAAGRSASASQTLTELATPTASLSISPSTVPSTGGSILLTYSASNASSCTLSSTPALWNGANPVNVGCSGTYMASVPPGTTQRSWTFAFTATNAAGESTSASQTLTQLAPAPAHTSTNWSGYVVPSGSLLTDVGGTWQVPKLDCSATPDSGVGTWLGLGGAGAGSGTLLQTGVVSDCASGVQQDRAFWELLPAFATYFTGFTVYPGDTIEATVFETTTGAWETRVDDLTTGISGVMVTGEGWGVLPDGSSTFPSQGSTVGLTYLGGYSAEWIVEDYDQNGSQVPFADYGTVTFTDLSTSLSSWSLTWSESIALVQSGTVLSTPAPPTGTGFSVSYTGP